MKHAVMICTVQDLQALTAIEKACFSVPLTGEQLHALLLSENRVCLGADRVG